MSRWVWSDWSKLQSSISNTCIQSQVGEHTEDPFQLLLQAESGSWQVGFNRLPSYYLLFSHDADDESGQSQDGFLSENSD